MRLPHQLTASCQRATLITLLTSYLMTIISLVHGQDATVVAVSDVWNGVQQINAQGSISNESVGVSNDNSTATMAVLTTTKENSNDPFGSGSVATGTGYQIATGSVANGTGSAATAEGYQISINSGATGTGDPIAMGSVATGTGYQIATGSLATSDQIATSSVATGTNISSGTGSAADGINDPFGTGSVPTSIVGPLTTGSVATSNAEPLTTGSVATSNVEPLTTGSVATSNVEPLTTGSVATSTDTPFATGGAADGIIDPFGTGIGVIDTDQVSTPIPDTLFDLSKLTLLNYEAFKDLHPKNLNRTYREQIQTEPEVNYGLNPPNVYRALDENRLDPERFDETYRRVWFEKRADCAKWLDDPDDPIDELVKETKADTDDTNTDSESTDRVDKKSSLHEEDGDQEETRGVLGSLELVTSLGGKFLAPIKQICHFRTPLVTLIKALESLIAQFKAMQAPRSMRRPARGSRHKLRNGQSPGWLKKVPDHCDCSGFGDDPTLQAQFIHSLESAATLVRQVLKTVDILLVSPFGGLCKQSKDDEVTNVEGKGVGDLLPLSLLG